jgi:hypothetical protein
VGLPPSFQVTVVELWQSVGTVLGKGVGGAPLAVGSGGWRDISARFGGRW